MASGLGEGVDAMLASCGARVMQPGDTIDPGELQQSQEREAQQQRYERQTAEAARFDATRATLVAEGEVVPEHG